jgi:hypothetical protein
MNDTIRPVCTIMHAESRARREGVVRERRIDSDKRTAALIVWCDVTVVMRAPAVASDNRCGVNKRILKSERDLKKGRREMDRVLYSTS